jgi:hypothetical protein
MKSAKSTVTVGYLWFILLALPFLIVASTALGSGAMDVQCGDVLDIDKGQYRLNGDLECPFNVSSTAVTITGNGVHFNLAGYQIGRNDDTGRLLLQGIAVSGANAHINGGSIVDFNCPDITEVFREDCAAIRLIEAPGSQISGMSLHNNTNGIITFGIPVDNADGAHIAGNDITGNLLYGIGLFGTAEGARITGNDLSDNGGYMDSGGGVVGAGYFGTSDGVYLIDNVANNCVRWGIFLWGREDLPAAKRNTLRGNTTLDNGRFGIMIWGSTEAQRPRDNLIQHNTSFGNGNFDLRSGFPGGGRSPDCVNTWKDNDFENAAPADCIE